MVISGGSLSWSCWDVVSPQSKAIPLCSKTEDAKKTGEKAFIYLSVNLNYSSFFSPFKSVNHIIMAVKWDRICQKNWIRFLRPSFLKKRKPIRPSAMSSSPYGELKQLVLNFLWRGINQWVSHCTRFERVIILE